MTVEEFKALQQSLLPNINAVQQVEQSTIQGVQNVLIETPDLSNIDEDTKTLRKVFELLNYQFPITLMRYSLSEFMRECKPSDTTPKETLRILALRCLNKELDNPTYEDFYNGLMGIEPEPVVTTGAASVLDSQGSQGVTASTIFAGAVQPQTQPQSQPQPQVQPQSQVQPQPQVQAPQEHLTFAQKIQKFANEVLSIAIAEPKGAEVYRVLSGRRFMKPYAYTSIDAWARSAYTSFDKQFVLDFGRSVEGITYFTDDFYLEDTYIRVLKAKSFMYNAFFSLKLPSPAIVNLYNIIDSNDILDAEIALLKLVMPLMCYSVDKEKFAQNKVRDLPITIYAPDGTSFSLPYKELGLYTSTLAEYSKQAYPVLSVGEAFELFFVDQAIYNNMIIQHGFVS